MPLPSALLAGGYDVAPADLYGVVLLMHPSDATYEVEVERAPDSAGAPNVGAAATIGSRLPASLPFFVDFVPNDGVLRWYRLRHTDPRGEDPGDWTAWQSATPEPVTPELVGMGDARRRVDSLYAEEGVLALGVKQRGNGVTVRRIAKGHLAGTGKNGDAITFPENFQSPPLVVVDGGISYEPRAAQWIGGTYSATLPQYFQREAVNISVAGFTLRGRLSQKGGSTPRSHNFPASNNLDVVGETTALTLANAPSNNDQYTAHYSVSLVVTNNGGGIEPETFAELKVAIDVMTDGVTWVERATRTYQESDIGGGGSTTLTIAHEAVTVAVTGVDSTDQIRIRIISKTVWSSPGSSGTATFSVHGFDGTGDPDSGVTYATATDIFATMTPDAQDVLSWHAIEVDA